MGLAEERARARGLATRIVSLAITIGGLLLVALGLSLTFMGGMGLLFVTILLVIAGLGLAFVGFFFQLVPFRVDELAQAKRTYDAQGPQEEDRHGR